MTSTQMGRGARRCIIRLIWQAALRAMAARQAAEDHLRCPAHSLSRETGTESGQHSTLMGASVAPSNAPGQTVQHLLRIGMKAAPAA